MQPVTYRFSKSQPLLDSASLMLWAVLVSSSVIALWLGLWWLEAPGIEAIVKYGRRDVVIFQLFFALAVTAGVALILTLLHKSPARNFLTLDETGLTHVRMGLRHSWPWRDLESLGVKDRLFGKAARLAVLGRFGWKTRLGMLSVSGFGAADRLVIRLPDLYEAPIEDIAATLNYYRDRALGTGPPGEAAARTPERIVAEPGETAIFTKSDTSLRQDRYLNTLAVFLGPSMILVGGLYLTFAEQSWPLGRVALPVLLAVCGGSILVWALFALRANSQERNFLRLDHAGLTYMHGGVRHAWPWRDLPAFEYRILPQANLIGRRRVITFDAPGCDEIWRGLRRFYRISGERSFFVELWRSLRRNARPSEASPGAVIEDIYDAPLSDIAATLNAYRGRAEGDTTGTARRARLRAAAESGQPTTFSKSSAQRRPERRSLFFNCVFVGVIVAGAGTIVYDTGYRPWHDPWSIDTALDLFLGLAVVALLVSAFTTYRAGSPKRNFLRLDGRGLTYLRRGKRYTWPWRDLPVFEYRILERTRPHGRRRAIVFAAPGKDRVWRRLGRSYRLPSEPPVVVIEDIYDTQLSDVAATLNAYRDHALGGGDATDGPQAPEPA